MAGYAFTALNLAADKIPDKVWHNIPGGYFCPPEVKEEKEREKAEERGENVDDKARSRKSDNRERRSPDKERPRKLPSDSEDSDRSRDSKSRRNRDKDRNRSRRDGRDDRDRDRNRDRKEERDGDRKRRDDKPQRRPQAQRSRGSGYLDRGYESDSGPKPKPSKLRESDYYFPPPPTEAVNHYVDPRSGEHVYQPTAPYHPSQFDASPGYRDNYYSGHPEEQDPYTPAEHEPDHEGDSEREDDIKSGQRNVKGLIEDSPERTRSSARQASSRSGQKYTPGPTNPYSPPPSQNGYAMPPYTAPQNPYAQQSAPGYVHPAYVAPVAAGVPYAPSPQAYGAGPPPGAYPPQHGYQYGYSPPQGYMPPPNAAAAQAMPYRQRYPSPYDSDGYPIGDEKREAKLREQSKRAKSASRGRSRAKSKSQKEESDDDDESGSGSDDDKKEGSRGPPQNRQRSTSRLREQIQTYGKRHVDLGTAALGALAGGFIGRNVGKGGEWGTILGAAIGGLGGAYGEKAIEKRRNHQKEKERKHEYHRGRRHGHREEQGRSHSRRGRSRSKVGGYDSE